MSYTIYIDEDRRRSIETSIAETILNNPEIVWKSVKKVSEAMIELIEEQLKENPRLIYSSFKSMFEILYSETAFARLGDPTDKPMIKTSKGSQADMVTFVNIVLNTLKSDDKSLLPLIINIHAEFGGHVLRQLPIKKIQRDKRKTPSLYQLACQKVSKFSKARETLRNHFYLYKDRPRFDLYGPHPRTNYTTPRGILPQDQTPEAQKGNKTFIRANDRTLPNENHPYYESIQKKGIPFVAGPSGHTGILLRTALTLSDLSVEELQEYLMGITSMIVGGGMHGFHEIMLVAHAIGLPYLPGSYHETFPKRLLEHPSFKTIEKEFPEISKSLGDPNEALPSIEDIFFKALRSGDAAITSELIHLGIAIDLRDSSNQTALEYAILLGHEDIAAELVKSDIDISILGDDAVNEALMMHWNDLAEALIERGARIDILDCFGKRPIDYALTHGNYALVNQLLSMGQTLPYGHSFNLNIALMMNLEHLITALLTQIDNIDELYFEKPPALMVAAMQGNIKAIHLLIEKGMNINCCDKEGHTALHWATVKGQTDVVEYLVQNNVDCNLLDKNGNTALHLAAYDGHVNAAKILMQKTDLSIKNHSNQTALDIANQYNQTTIQQLLTDDLIHHKKAPNFLQKIESCYKDEIQVFKHQWQKNLKNACNPFLFLAPEFSLSEQKPSKPTFHSNYFEAPQRLVMSDK